MSNVDVVVLSDVGDAHGDAVLTGLADLGVDTLRYNLADIRAVPLLAEPGVINIADGGVWRRITSQTTAWWRRAGIVSTDGLEADEARLAADESPHILRGAFSAAGARWVDDPSDVDRAELKLYQLGVARSLGLVIPPSQVTNDPAAAQAFGAGRRVVAKPLSPGFGIAPFVAEVTGDDFDRVAVLPTLLQEMVVRATADLRVVVVGREAWAWRRPRSETTIDWRAEDPEGSDFTRLDNADVCLAAVRMTSALQLSMSVQDWLETPDGPVFLEANPQGAWLFLSESATVVTPAVARHLSALPATTGGTWPRAIKRFGYDFLPVSKAPSDDGVVAPRFRYPVWASEAAARPGAIEVARRAHDEAKGAAQVAEDKASRLVQVALALLTIALAVGAFQANFALDRSWPWLFSLVPIVGALVFLALAAFEALEIDRVGVYSHPTAESLTAIGVHDPVETVIAEEEVGRQLARWTSTNKHTDLMQARAWFSRGLAALILSGVVAATSRAATSGDDKPTVEGSTTTTSQPSGSTTTTTAPPTSTSAAPTTTSPPTSAP